MAFDPIRTAHPDGRGFAYVYLAGQTIEVSVDTGKDIFDTIEHVRETGEPWTYTIPNDFNDVAFLIGPSTPIVIEFPTDTFPRR